MLVCCTVGVEWVIVMDVLNLNAMWYNIIEYKKTIIDQRWFLSIYQVYFKICFLMLLKYQTYFTTSITVG